jgi:hypothetical protein
MTGHLQTSRVTIPQSCSSVQALSLPQARAGVLKGIAEGLIDPRSLTRWSYDLVSEGRTVERFGFSKSNKDSSKTQNAPTAQAEPAKPVKEYISTFKKFMEKVHQSGDFPQLPRKFWNDVDRIETRSQFDAIIKNEEGVFLRLAERESPYVRGESGALKAGLVQQRMEDLGFSKDECQKSKSWYPLFGQSAVLAAEPQVEEILPPEDPAITTTNPPVPAPGDNSNAAAAEGNKKKKKKKTAANATDPPPPSDAPPATLEPPERELHAAEASDESDPRMSALVPKILELRKKGTSKATGNPTEIIANFQKICETIAEKGSSGIKIKERKALLDTLMSNILATDLLEEVQTALEGGRFFNCEQLEDLAYDEEMLLSGWNREKESTNNRIAKWYGPIADEIGTVLQLHDGSWNGNTVVTIRKSIDTTLVGVDDSLTKEYTSRKANWLSGDKSQLPFVKDADGLMSEEDLSQGILTRQEAGAPASEVGERTDLNLTPIPNQYKVASFNLEQSSPETSPGSPAASGQTRSPYMVNFKLTNTGKPRKPKSGISK